MIWSKTFEKSLLSCMFLRDAPVHQKFGQGTQKVTHHQFLNLSAQNVSSWTTWSSSRTIKLWPRKIFYKSNSGKDLLDQKNNNNQLESIKWFKLTESSKSSYKYSIYSLTFEKNSFCDINFVILQDFCSINWNFGIWGVQSGSNYTFDLFKFKMSECFMFFFFFLIFCFLD